MSDRLTLIVNPAAGNGTVSWADVERVLGARGPVTRVTPVGEAALADAVRSAANAGHVIVVAGGDGTLNRVVNATDTTTLTIGIIPSGSGNDLARGVGAPARLLDAARRVVDGTPVPMDLVEVNGVRLCTVGGVGLVADVTDCVSRLAQAGRPARLFVRMLGANAYLLAAAIRLAMPVRVSSCVSARGDGPDAAWQWDGESHAVLVANHPTLGAGLRLPIAASAGDGLCEICIVPRRSRASLAVHLAALRSGRPLPEEVLTVRRARRAVIEAGSVVPFAADGDLRAAAQRFDVRVLPSAVRVIR